MACKKSDLIALAKSWKGKKESDGSFKFIIDIYNSHLPLARGYKMTYKDAWCATFISALAIKLNATDIIPTECGCERQIDLFKKLGVWIEDESITPQTGDIIYYDWQDSGVGDNKGFTDHVGVVTEVNGKDFVVTEGNYSDMVKDRKLTVNARYIRGYARPKYLPEDKQAEPVKKEEPKKEEAIPTYYIICQGDTLSKISRQFGVSIDELVRLNNIANPNRIYAGQKIKLKEAGVASYPEYIVNTNIGTLTIRAGAGTNYADIGQLAKGARVKVSSVSNGWAKLADRAGYCSTKYLKKV